MRRKTASIIGRIVGLILVAALAFGVTWCATNWSTVKAETSKWWDKITGNEQQEIVQPTPEDPTPDTPTPETPISLDGMYILDVDGDKTVVQLQNGEYRSIPACFKESGEVVFDEGWESEEFVPYLTREDDNYIYVYVVDQDNGVEYNIGYCVKATNKLYYDFTNGDLLPGQSEYVIEMTPFTDFTICAHDWQEDLTYVPNPPTCGEWWDEQWTCAICGCSEIRWEGPLQHDYVDGVCGRCGIPDMPIISMAGDILTIENYCENLSYCLAAESIDGNLGGGILTTISSECDITLADYSFFGSCGDNIFIYVSAFNSVNGIQLYSSSNYIPTYIPHCYINGVCTRCGEISNPHIYIEGDVLHLSYIEAMGTYNIYYTNLSTGVSSSYVAGNVTEFDLKLLLDRDLDPIIVGETYEITVMFSDDNSHVFSEDVVYYTATDSNENISLTWMFNDTIATFEDTIDYAVNFTSNGQQFCGVRFTIGAAPCMEYVDDSGSVLVAYDSCGGWMFGEEYKTIVFDVEPDGIILEYLLANATPLTDSEFACLHNFVTGVCEHCGATAIHYSMMGVGMFEDMQYADVESEFGSFTICKNEELSRFEYDFGDFQFCLGYFEEYENYFFYIDGVCEISGGEHWDNNFEIYSATGHFFGETSGEYTSTII